LRWNCKNFIMVWAVDDFASWLLGLLADAGRRRLITWVLGTDQERALRSAAVTAVRRTAAELSPADAEQAAHIAMVVDQVFVSPLPQAQFGTDATLLEVVRNAIAAQIAPLGDADLTGLGRSSADLLGVSITTLAEMLTHNLLREVVIRGAVGGPLVWLANQLSHEQTQALGRQIEHKVDRRVDEVLEVLTRLERVTLVTPAAVHSLPSDLASFTGRQADLERLVHSLRSPAVTGGVVQIDAIDGMAGVGKTAFAVHVAHHLAPRFPDGQLFVRLHGHTSGQRPVEPIDALATLLLAIGVAPQQIPAGLDDRAALWRDRMAHRKALLLLDDATGDDQIRPLLPGTDGTLVLVTSRRRLTALTEAFALTLDVLAEKDATQLFSRVVNRPGLLPSEPAVAQIVTLCGHLPLAISLVAGQLKYHPAWTAADLVVELTSAADRLSPMAAGNLSVTTAFELSYRNLPADEQRLFRRLGLNTGTDIDAYAAAFLDDSDVAAVRTCLAHLYEYHLVDEPARGRYRFHDLIREHARVLAGTDEQHEREEAIRRLLAYYTYMARSADRHLARRTSTDLPPVINLASELIPGLSTWQEAVNWMDAERLNLLAAANYAALHGLPTYAIAIAQPMYSYMRNQGHWHQAVILHRIALDEARQARDRLAEAGCLMDLGVMEYLTADYSTASTDLGHAVDLYHELGNLLGEANALTDLGVVQNLTGKHSEAVANAARAVELHRDVGNELGEATALAGLGTVQYMIGEYADATANLARALALHHRLGNRLGEANALNNLGVVQYLTGDYPAAVESLGRSAELHADLGNRLGEANALTELGVVQRLTGSYEAATASEIRALSIYRDLGAKLGEGTALNNLGVVQYLIGDYPSADGNLTLALQMHRHLGNRTGEAEALNHLGELRLASAATSEAYACHDEARRISVQIGALFEQGRALEGIGRCQLKDGQLLECAESLHQALVLYQRIGSPNAQRVEATLRDYGL
jgi:tetratricopeptide (TPR) repeat protein